MKTVFSYRGSAAAASVRTRLRSFFAVPVLLACVLCFGTLTGCEADPEIANNVEQSVMPTYSSQYGESYILSDSAITYDDGYGGGFTGDSVYVHKINDTSGTVFFKYSTNSYDSTLVGKYCATSYKNLTENSVSLSNAYKAGGASAMDTLEQAVAEFTIENGYFAYYGEYAK